MNKIQINVIIGLLGVIAVFQGIQTFSSESKSARQNLKEEKSKKSSKPSIPIEVVMVEDKTKKDIKYEYKWKEVSRTDTEFDWKENIDRGYDMHHYDLFGWEYVGPLYNNGINSQYILLRRPKRK